MGRFKENLRNLAAQQSKETKDREDAERRRTELEKREYARKLRESEAAIKQYAVPVLQDVNAAYLQNKGRLRLIIAKRCGLDGPYNEPKFGDEHGVSGILWWGKTGDQHRGSVNRLEISTNIEREPRVLRIEGGLEIFPLSEEKITELLQQGILEMLKQGKERVNWRSEEY